MKCRIVALLFFLAFGVNASGDRVASKPGSVRLILGFSAVYSKKDIKLNTRMKTDFVASYLYAPDGVQTLEGNWGVDPVGNAQNIFTHPITVNIPVPPAANNPIPENAGRKFIFLGAFARHWYQGLAVGDGGENADLHRAADARHRPPMRAELGVRALFGAAGPGNAALLPNNDMPANKAFLPAQAMSAEGVHECKLAYDTWNLRAEVGLGYAIVEDITLCLICMYTFSMKNKNIKNTKDGIGFETKGQEVGVLAVNGQTAQEANFVRASFAYAQGKLMEGMKAKIDVEETVAILGSVCWSPSDVLELAFKLGLKRYKVSADFTGGMYAYPATVGMYTEAFLKTDDQYKMWVANSVTRKMSAIEWPLTFGGSIRLKLDAVQSLTFDVEYTSFQGDLSVTDPSDDADDVDDSSDENNAKVIKPSVVAIENPLGTAVPDRNQMRDAEGIHQTLALNVLSSLNAKVDIQDLTISAGYMIVL